MTLDDFPGTCIGKFTGRLNALRSAAVTHSQFHDPVPCAPARDIMRTLRYGIVPTLRRDSQIFVEIFHCIAVLYSVLCALKVVVIRVIYLVLADHAEPCSATVPSQHWAAQKQT